MNDKITLGITHGDINGIGYELIIKCMEDPRIFDFCTPVIYGSPKVAAYHRKALNIGNFSFNNIKSVEEANQRRANIINCIDEETRVELGLSTDIAGESSFLALEAAVQDLADGKIDALVTAPINKNNMPAEKFNATGHTEYLAKKFGNAEPLMLMVCENLKVGVVTGHIPISKVAESITEEKVLKNIEKLNDTLIRDFVIRKPRIAVLGLNPHIGDKGLIGEEEKNAIAPAIEKAREKGIMALGPFSADGLFGSDNYSKFDAVLAMYHDQGLAPFKALSNNMGVNFTAGLNVIRTSPAHGVAYELAGKNEAGIESFMQSIYLACDVFRNRKLNEELTKNPLPHYDVENL